MFGDPDPIRMFLGLPDPDPVSTGYRSDPDLVPASDPSIIKSSSKNSKKNIHSRAPTSWPFVSGKQTVAASNSTFMTSRGENSTKTLLVQGQCRQWTGA